VVLPLWVVENRPSPLLWPLAYTTACTTVQAVIKLEAVTVYAVYSACDIYDDSCVQINRVLRG